MQACLLMALLCAATGGLAASEPAPASATSASLSPADQETMGLAGLSAAELEALNAAIAREVTLAHEGAVTGFAGTFLSRRTPEERAMSGLDRLSAEQQSQLNAHVARRLAQRSLARWPGYQPPPPRTDEPVVAAPAGLEVHSQVSVSYGGGSGTRVYGGRMNVRVDDPKHRFSISVGYSEFHTEFTDD